MSWMTQTHTWAHLHIHTYTHRHTQTHTQRRSLKRAAPKTHPRSVSVCVCVFISLITYFLHHPLSPLSFFGPSFNPFVAVFVCDGHVLQQHSIPLFLTMNFDLRAHVENLGHGVAGCLGVQLSPRRCCGFLTKRGGRVKTWRRRWFLFDMDHRRLAYYTGEEHHELRELTVYNILLCTSF